MEGGPRSMEDRPGRRAPRMCLLEGPEKVYANVLVSVLDGFGVVVLYQVVVDNGSSLSYSMRNAMGSSTMPM